jgi:hypothetical protein
VAALVICASVAPGSTAGRPRLSLDGPPVFSEASASESAPTPTVHASTVGYLLGGLGVALGATAIGVYLWNRGQDQDAQAEEMRVNQLAGTAAHYDAAIQYNQHVDAINRDGILTVGMAVVSVGLIAGGLYLVRTDRKRGETHAELGGRRSWLAASPGGVFWSGIW